MKDFSWNIIPWNALLFEKTLKQNNKHRFSIYRELRIYFKHMSWHGETCGNKGGFSRYFVPDDRLSLNLHRFVILYRSCDTRAFDITVYWKCPLALRGVLESQMVKTKLPWEMTCVVLLDVSYGSWRVHLVRLASAKESEACRFQNRQQDRLYVVWICGM